jgi:hypothetical protein
VVDNKQIPVFIFIFFLPEERASRLFADGEWVIFVYKRNFCVLGKKKMRNLLLTANITRLPIEEIRNHR